MSLDNIFAAIPENLNEEIIDVLQQNGQVKIERIVSTGQTSPEIGWYDQAQHEWVIVLKGEAIIAFENKETTLKKGGYINIPAHTKHRVSWTHPQVDTVWLAIHY
ncbi:Uncharacterized conserved protein [hydrothermal vent metagenome]|uniref:Uncharacterized conserved protein n=1 Tax=hydrothermal vent metagenome TaxID=652676 RepID=A0A3B0WIR1_9ZZZZ